VRGGSPGTLQCSPLTSQVRSRASPLCRPFCALANMPPSSFFLTTQPFRAPSHPPMFLLCPLPVCFPLQLVFLSVLAFACPLYFTASHAFLPLLPSVFYYLLRPLYFTTSYALCFLLPLTCFVSYFTVRAVVHVASLYVVSFLSPFPGSVPVLSKIHSMFWGGDRASPHAALSLPVASLAPAYACQCLRWDRLDSKYWPFELKHT